ncbi:AraC family transcriptional regulator [Curvivirga aplysinae]|uniref:AraC family transcriptional regulator n=1 Tax=Curvivirga aplysinae TaxID=2529852 RepID=UPI0012BC07F3|nr:AraC family transcriptional regulator [Curvivirga aplysinae]MTI09776.1 helix-turn-helix domain-containing protein [Curvivirga aplysinae]
MTDAYKNRMNRVCDYIATHLDEDLSVEKLACIANFSRFHFHRQFQAYVGLNVSAYVKLARLKRASYHLVYKKERKVIDIAFDAGFETPESFSRAFKKTFNQTPTAFRKDPDWLYWHAQYDFNIPTEEKLMDIKIIDFEATKIAALEHHGAPALVNKTVDKFIEWRMGNNLSPYETHRTFGIIYNDPNNVEPDDFRFDVCGEVEQDIPDNSQGIVSKNIPAGKCAVARNVGPHRNMDKVVYQMYGEWLPESGEKTRDFPLFVEYKNSCAEVDESELITDIYIPLA